MAFSTACLATVLLGLGGRGEEERTEEKKEQKYGLPQHQQHCVHDVDLALRLRIADLGLYFRFWVVFVVVVGAGGGGRDCEASERMFLNAERGGGEVNAEWHKMG